MLELGSETVWEHTQVLNYCHDNKLDVITVGTCFSNIEPKSFSSSDQLYSFISKNPIENRTILLKGSRGIKLEKIIELL
jgi:UDP-N-acetylmuramoyl-tripeptide--D-alanyl-D-alanine ligase